MTGVSHRGPVSGANGLGKVHLKFKPKPPPRGHRILGVIMYSILFALIGLSFAWSRPWLRYGYVVPSIRRMLSVIDRYKSGTIFLPVSTDVERDDFGVATLFGDSLNDVLKLQGQAHATDRLLQMEIYRRTAFGSLSEYYGNRTVESDKFWRLLNIRNLVENDYISLSDENKIQINAYTDGINTYLSEAIKTNTLPIDFTLLFGYELNSTIIQLWKPTDTLAILRMLSYTWSTGWEDQLRHKLLSTSLKVNIEDLWKLHSDINPEGYISVSGAVVIPSIGSTIIAINKQRSTTKSALLGSSITNMVRNILYFILIIYVIIIRIMLLHVYFFVTQASHSGLWYLNNLHIKNQDTLAGASVPGVPFIFHGRNTYTGISWSFTQYSTSSSIEEIFIRSDTSIPDIPDKDDDNKEDIIQYREEYIHIRGETNPLPVVLQETLLGPIITYHIIPITSSSISHILQSTEQLVLSSNALQKNNVFFHTLYSINSRSSSFEEFRSVVQGLDCVSLQFVYADKDGNIGSVVSGR